MPRQISPEEALERIKGVPENDTPREAISTRVQTKLWKAIAEYGQQRRLKDMSSAYRAILEDWHQIQNLKGEVGLDAIPTEDLCSALRARGKVVVGRKELRKAMNTWLIRFRTRTKSMMDKVMSDEKIGRAVEQIAKGLT